MKDILLKQDLNSHAVKDEIDETGIDYVLPALTINNKIYKFGRKTYIMGIINVTPDSFSKDGLYGKNNYIDLALAQASGMAANGADFLDIGAESTRPNAPLVSSAEEEERLLPAVKELAKSFKLPLSVDTYKPEVAEKALNLGASIINDIWGLQFPGDPERRMAKIVAEAGVPVIMMHNRTEKIYRYLIKEITGFLSDSIRIAENAGVKSDKLIIDPGIGFGKTYEDNLAVLKNLHRFKVLRKPILLGTSRKSVIGVTLDLPVEERLEGTIATVVWGITQGVNIVRVHDVKEAYRAVKMCDAIRNC